MGVDMKRLLFVFTIFYFLFLTGCSLFEPIDEFDFDALPPTAAGGETTVTSQVASSAGDAEQFPSGSVSLSSSDLELIDDKGKLQVIGIRFKLDIPQGAQITDATIQFTTDEATTGPASLQIFAEASDNAAAFAKASNNISNRPATSASVSWSPLDWKVVGDSTDTQRTPSIASITQEVILRSGWTSGNHIAYIIQGSGTRTAESFDGSPSAAPKLIVSYTLDDPEIPPIELPIEPPAGDFLSVTTQVASPTDDAEEQPTGGVSLSSSDLELIDDKGKLQIIGLRFKLDIPQGAIIEDSKIQFTTDETSSGTADFNIHAEASDDSSTFSTALNNVKSRAKTTAVVNWSPPGWDTVGSATADQQTPSLAALTQEIVSREGWVNGNYISFIITGTGTRTAESFDGVPDAAAKLTVHYTLPGEPKPEFAYHGNDYAVNEKPIYDHGYRDGFMSVDEDADGLPDSWELAHGLDPSNPADATDVNLDPDNDLLTAHEEFLTGTNPNDSDSDGDGLPDGYELVYGLNPIFSGDALLDSDGDGYSNLVEFNEGSDPENSTSNPIVVGPEPSTYDINLSWKAPVEREDGSSLSSNDISGFSIFYGLSAASPDTTINLSDSAQLSYTINDLAAGTYYFTIKTVDITGGISQPSQQVELTVPQ